MKKGILAVLGLCALVAIVPACDKKNGKKAKKPAAAKKVKTPKVKKGYKKPAAPMKNGAARPM